MNEKLVRTIYEPANNTHYGKISLEVYEDLANIIVYFTVETKDKTFINQKINLCKWFAKPKNNVLINMFNNYYRHSWNRKLLTCPIRKGSYVVAGSRPIVTNPELFRPLYMPVLEARGNITIASKIKVQIRKKFEDLGDISETFEFY